MSGPAKIVTQLFKISTNKDGGGRIQFDFGADALREIQKIQNWNGSGGMNFAIAVVPYNDEMRADQKKEELMRQPPAPTGFRY